MRAPNNRRRTRSGTMEPLGNGGDDFRASPFGATEYGWRKALYSPFGAWIKAGRM